MSKHSVNALSDLQAEWPAINRLLDEALELPPSERSAWLAALPAEAGGLKGTVARLLAATGGVETDDFLHTLPKLGAAPSGPVATGTVAGAEVGPWRLLREIGEGGMGSVWLAERADGSLKRQVALKLPRLSWQRGLAERLARERDILATLEHPHIARLYDAGVDALGRPWLALEYVQGEPIDAWARARSLGLQQLVSILLQACEAVAHAHSRLVLHRDLKPGNIFVTAQGEVKLLDFGIARLMVDEAGDDSLTRDFGLPMTPRYASPEQLLGERIGVASDVYSFTVVAYELLAGRLPFGDAATTSTSLLRAVQDSEPPRASERCADATLRRALRGDLDAILAKGLARQADRRYATAEALAEDLRRWLRGAPVLARPDSAAYRARKFAARHRWGVGLSAGAAVTVLAASGTAALRGIEARHNAERALQVQRFVINIFSDANPDAGGRSDTSALTLLRQAGQRLDRHPPASAALEAELRSALGASLRGLGAYDEAEAAQRRAADSQQAAHGPDDARTIAAEITHAEALVLAGRHEAAAQRLQALNDGDRLARRSALRADALRVLSQLHLLGNRPREALAEARKAVEDADAVQPPDAALRARVYGQLTAALNWVNEPGAVAAAQTALAALREAEGEALSGEQLQLRALLAGSLAFEGRGDEAIRELEALVASARATYGPWHVTLANVLNRAGTAKVRLQPEAALRDFEEAQRIFVGAAAGRPTADSAINAVALAAQYAHLRRPAEALRAADAGLATALQVFEPAHGVTMALRRQRVMAMARLGRLAEAEALLPPLEADAAARPRRWPPLLSLRAELRLRGGRPADAERDARQAIAELESQTNDTLLWQTRLLLASALEAQGRLAEAASLAQAVADALDSHAATPEGAQALAIVARAASRPAASPTAARPPDPRTP